MQTKNTHFFVNFMLTNFVCVNIFKKPQLHKNAFLSQSLKICYDFSRELLCKKINANTLVNIMFQNFYHFGANKCFH